MRESPRTRRLRTDLRALEKLREDSSILDFSVPGPMFGGPPEVYVVRFRGRGLQRAVGNQVSLRDEHELTIQLGASYPRMMPDLHWKTPIFHPNISASGAVCLGGYGTYWVPSVNLDELCEMLWDMVRYQNYDVDSPYNREAALWAKTQSQFRLPLDGRSIRDRVANNTASGDRPEAVSTRGETVSSVAARSVPSWMQDLSGSHAPSRPLPSPPAPDDPEIIILDDRRAGEIVDAEVIEADEPEILFLN